jgi:hypothetical protein
MPLRKLSKSSIKPGLTYAIYPTGWQAAQREPKLFRSIGAAEHFLKAELAPTKSIEKLVSGITEDCAPAAVSVEQAAEEADNSRHLFPTKNRAQWSDPMVVKYAAQYTGARCDLSIEAFLPLGDVDTPEKADPFTDLEIERLLSSPDPCYLADDWRFEQIRRSAWAMLEPAENKLTSICAIVIRAIHHLERAFQRRFPDSPAAMVADFWQSQQVDKFIADLCRNLRASETVRSLARHPDLVQRQLEEVREFVGRRIARFAQEISELRIDSVKITGRTAIADIDQPSNASDPDLEATPNANEFFELPSRQAFKEKALNKQGRSQGDRLGMQNGKPMSGNPPRGCIQSMVAVENIEKIRLGRGESFGQFTAFLNISERTYRSFRQSGILRSSTFADIASRIDKKRKDLLTSPATDE